MKKPIIKNTTLSIILAALAVVNVFGIGFSSFIINSSVNNQIGDIIVTVGGQVDISNLTTTTPKLVVGQSHFGGATTSENKTSLKASFDVKFSIDKPYAFTIELQQIKNPGVANPKYPNFDITNYITSIGIAATRSTLTKPDPLVYTTHNISKDATNKIKFTTFNTNQAPFNAGNSLKGVVFNVDLIVKFNYSGVNFSNDVYIPMNADSPSIGLELK